ncbi:MAG: energy transducer TonB [Acetobacteraceae bacterium]
MRAAGRRGGEAARRLHRQGGREKAMGSGRLTRPAVLSVLLHLVVLAALLIGVARQRQEAFVPPAPIAVVFEHGGAARATAPSTRRRGQPMKAELRSHAPPVAPAPLPLPAPEAPPAPRIAPGVAVRLPPAPEVEALMQQPSPPRRAPLAVAPPVAAGRPAPARRPVAPRSLYLPSFSYGAAPRPQPAVPQRGLNLALSQSELRRAFAPDFAIEGKIGPDWRAELTRWVDQRKYYPYSAIEMGQQGSVEIRLVIDKSGKVAAVSLLQTSGSPFLDAAWLGLFRGATVPSFPPGTTANRITIRATMHYILME